MAQHHSIKTKIKKSCPAQKFLGCRSWQACFSSLVPRLPFRASEEKAPIRVLVYVNSFHLSTGFQVRGTGRTADNTDLENCVIGEHG